MKLRRIALENVRSFLDRAELLLDSDMSIIIGPNGGGKTNLLDATNIALRRYLIATLYARHSPTPEARDRYEFVHNDALNNLVLEKHSAGKGRQQLIEVELEVTQIDVENIQRMKTDAVELCTRSELKYLHLPLREAKDWKTELVEVGQHHVYRIVDGQLQAATTPSAGLFLQYLKNFEIDGLLRSEHGMAELSTPMIYLPVNRAGNGFQSSVQLHGFKEGEQKRQVDATISKNPSQIAALAIGRLATKYRLLLEKDNTLAKTQFRTDKNLKELTDLLRDLGYEWELETKDPLTNEYDPGGHFNFLHPWPGQTPPLDSSGTVG